MRRLGLYVHIPFCSIKCYYCDFAAFSGQGRSTARYLRALEAEAALRPAARIDTLYIGGGTPSELGAGGLELLFSMLARRYGRLDLLRETTVEGNPESLDSEKLDILRRAGVGRLSLGLQTASDRLLKAIGRKHSRADFLRVYRSARERGFDVSVDLMFGLPGQTFDDAMESLRQVAGLEPEHVSLYSLQVEDRTLFGKREVEVDEDLARETMEASLDFLDGAGYRHYEVSNFARPGKESIHNLNYWADGEYVGLGCSAAGHLSGVRYQNEERLKSYCERVEKGELPVASSESLSGKEKLGEMMMLGLRRISGLDITADMRRQFGPELDRLVARGLLRIDGRKASLSREGIFLANEAFREFVAPFGA